VQKINELNRQSIKMKIRPIAFLCAALSLAVSSSQGASYSVVRSFGVLTNVSGFQPQTPLVQDGGGVLYGITSMGEGNLTGTVFKIQPDGTGFQVLMSFFAPVNLTNSTGASPHAGLALSGSTLYGTTYVGGSGGTGTVFKINTDGTGFTVLTNFPPLLNDTNSIGANPASTLVLSGQMLYGTTQGGGMGENGTIFSMNINGTGLSVLHTFSYAPGGINNDGTLPGGLVLSGTTLYGTADQGGDYGYGTMFMVGINGGPSFSVLHHFTAPDFEDVGENSDGASPQVGLVVDGNTLYGTAAQGGSDGSGTVFAYNLVTTGFAVLYNFTGFNDGGSPNGGLLLSGNALYGTASSGGADEFGTVFAVNTNGGPTCFTNLYSLNGSSDGGMPEAGMILSGGTLYGTTAGPTIENGMAGGNGSVFALNIDGSDFTNLFDFVYSDAVTPQAGLILCGGTLYGTTLSGGNGGNGTVFQVNPDGSAYTVLKCFSALSYNSLTGSSTNSDGANPQAQLVMSDGWLYGTTFYGGANDYGTVFAVTTNGTSFTNLYNFTGGTDGAYPLAGLVVSNGALYGTANLGGSGGSGTVFTLNTEGTGFRVLKTFSVTSGEVNGDGANPHASLLLSGNILYGTASAGGTAGYGTVFALNIDDLSFKDLYNFTNGMDGASPMAGLVLSGVSLYGTANLGGSAGSGTVYTLTTGGTGFTVLKTFSAVTQNTNSDGANPNAGLVMLGNTLYGTAANGGVNGYGTLFAVNTSMGFTNLHNFDYTAGANPYASLAFCVNTLYGAAFDGGTAGDGAVFALTLYPLPIPLNIQMAGVNVILSWTNSAFALQSAPSVGGTYTNVPNATSPFTNAVTDTQQFYRLNASYP